MTTICIIGLWHLGIINAVGFAEKGYNVVGIETDDFSLEKLKKGIPPLFEPGLEDLMKKHLVSKKLRFTQDVKSVGTADYVLVAYDSPVNDYDEADITPVKKAVRLIAKRIKKNTPIIITSQVPLGTCGKLEKKVKEINRGWIGGIAYVPENLRLGIAIERFMKPDMIVVGSDSKSVALKVSSLYKNFDTPIFNMDLKSAEMVKHALNTYLATAITFGNEIARLSEKLGANGFKVAQALKADKRIGKAPILPGLGFSGGTIARDVTQLIKFSKEKKHRSELLSSIVNSNEQTFLDVVGKLTKALGTLENKSIGILGLTYKPGTSTLRRSPSIKLIKLLNDQKAKCTAYDPKADPDESEKYSSLFKRAGSVKELADKADGFVLVTEWPEFKEINYKEIVTTMKNRFIVDTKNFLDSKKVSESGLKYFGFGQ